MLIFTVYFNPADFPDRFVVRGFLITAGRVRPDPDPVYVGGTLEGARAAIHARAPGLVRLARAPEDEPAIVEVWL